MGGLCQPVPRARGGLGHYKGSNAWSVFLFSVQYCASTENIYRRQTVLECLANCRHHLSTGAPSRPHPSVTNGPGAAGDDSQPHCKSIPLQPPCSWGVATMHIICQLSISCIL